MTDYLYIFHVEAFRIPDTIKAIRERGIKDAQYFQGHSIEESTVAVVRVEIPDLDSNQAIMLKKLWEQYGIRVVSEYVMLIEESKLLSTGHVSENP